MASRVGVVAIFCFTLFSLHSRGTLERETEIVDDLSEGEGALTLTDEMFDDFLKQNDEAMILFYAPWCYWSRLVLPEFDAAAKVMALHHSPVKMGKVDCTKQKQITAKEQIREFPTLKLFIRGQSQHYYGGRRRTDIINWMDAFLGRDKSLTSEAQLDELIQNINDNHLVVIAAFPPSYDNAAFASTSRRMGDSVFFGETSIPNVINHLKNKYLLSHFSVDSVSQISLPFIVVMRVFEDEMTPLFYGGRFDNADEISQFVRLSSFPSVVRFDNIWAPKLFADGRALFFVILDTADETQDNAEAFHAMIKMLNERTPHYMSKFLFIVSGNQDYSEKRLISQLALEDENYPIMRILTLKSTEETRDSPSKYKPLFDVPVNKESIIQFLEDFSANRLRPYVKSELPPDSNTEEDVKTLVGETFEVEVRNSSKDSFVMFHAPWCGHCRELLPAFTELAIRLKTVDDLDIAKLDATRNEVQNLPLAGYPSLILFPAKHKTEPLYFYGGRSVSDMMHWLAENVDRAHFSPRELLQKTISNDNDYNAEAEL
ncbi:putative thioredoxin [Cardiosporidium cionae]|uniref:Thioredoxin n=1 Tax=Cardiosporidium cionae TaxID=476202 RepID=A0ABQ7JF42_9APIC|nr:putative thioredoxin [Cardiosporidium cionae]|eukprot:KAF8822510.1 putative thioredoxin [Cardiosporidium cionae]